ncbi:MAG TPA: VOC family protein [Terriglobales bacterium]|jgi:PhnB protein|nr:VOC family protein [Terriglobales bacterium]
MKASQAIPPEFHTITPSLICRGATQAIEFYKKALGAEERMRMAGPDGKIMHAELKIGDSIIFVTDENLEMGCKAPQTLGGSPSSLYLYVQDVDKSFQRAIDAGGKVTMPVADMFWGDRFGSFTDPFGHNWGMSTRVEDLTEPEFKERSKAFFAQLAQQQKKTA